MASIADTLATVRAMRSRIVAATDDVAQVAAGVTLEEKLSALDEGTYSKPIPTNAEYRKGKPRKASSDASRPAWKRTNALRDGQAIENRGEGKRAVVTTGPGAVYEGRVADLPTGPDGINRSNAASVKGQRNAGKKLPAFVADELTKAVQQV